MHEQVLERPSALRQRNGLEPVARGVEARVAILPGGVVRGALWYGVVPP